MFQPEIPIAHRLWPTLERAVVAWLERPRHTAGRELVLTWRGAPLVGVRWGEPKR